MFELKRFQTEAAKLIASRYAFYSQHPSRPSKGPQNPRPFFQALSALTGAGKTPILAQAVSQIRAQLTVEPIILWMSKARSVVTQTYNNFSAGGKYAELIPDFKVIRIPELRPSLISDGNHPLLVLTTTGLFNNRDKAEGNLNIYQKDNDLFGDKSPWVRLIEREHNGKRRPLIVVYDEGHNLSEQQTSILSELEPEAYLLASATLKLPQSFERSVLHHLVLWFEELNALQALQGLQAVDAEGSPKSELFFTTRADPSDVVAGQLVKKAIQFDGTTAPMEACIDDLIARLALLQSEIALRHLDFKPKAIYVCKTNIADDGQKDDPAKPFGQRNAPPIRIWRYLVDEKGVSPKDIAIYADLKFIEGNKPDEVNLFSNGENDFDKFQEQEFQHIIFNLSLQEGWDDPACYLAYIDKSMGSSIQVEQVIGRVLRQYGATHYPNPLLNSAHFFLRVDKESVFTEALAGVRDKLKAEGAPIEITGSFGPGATATSIDLSPKDDVKAELHGIFVDSEAAEEHVAAIVESFPTLAPDGPDTVGEARSASEVVDLLKPGATTGVKWKPDGHTNAVRLRWLLSTAIRARSARAFSVVDLTDKKFDVKVQVQSRAHVLAEEWAVKIVQAFYQWSELSYESAEPFVFGTIRVRKDSPAFTNGLYERYGGLNPFELKFAQALDSSGFIWHRNPSSGGFRIPLLDEGDTAYFYPDFIVWKKGTVYCLDTKGSHILSDAVARKLFDVRESGRTKVLVRFITEGNQPQLRAKPSKGGYTIWKAKNGKEQAFAVVDLAKAVTECLR